MEDFELHKELYRGKTSLLYQATDRKSGTIIALKLYRKRKLSTLNRWAAGPQSHLSSWCLRTECVLHSMT